MFLFFGRFLDSWYRWIGVGTETMKVFGVWNMLRRQSIVGYVGQHLWVSQFFSLGYNEYLLFQHWTLERLFAPEMCKTSLHKPYLSYQTWLSLQLPSESHAKNACLIWEEDGRDTFQSLKRARSFCSFLVNISIYILFDNPPHIYGLSCVYSEP